MNTQAMKLLVGVVGASLVGCATSSGVVVNPSISKASYQSVYVVVHGDKSADMDANLQKELLRHGLVVTSGSEERPSTPTDLIARYADDWKWDLSMYLRSFDLMISDGKTNVLLASGEWKNSLFHGYYSSEKVVGEVVSNTLSKISPKQ